MIDQLGIAIFSLGAVVLSQDHRQAVRRWACILGLCAQPFWFHTTAAHEQWGIFGLSFIYSFFWMRGLYNFWWLGRLA